MLTGRQLSCLRESELPNSKILRQKSAHVLKTLHRREWLRSVSKSQVFYRFQATGSTRPTINKYDSALSKRLAHTHTKAK